MKTILLTMLENARSVMITGLLLIVLNGSLFASHIVGGEITYEHISGYVYKVRLEFYRDCAGILAPTSVQINARSVSCGFNNISTTLPQAGTPVLVSPLCSSSLSNSTCNGGNLYSVKKYSYEGLITLSGNCSDWEFYYTECCRNAAITNLAFPGAVDLYFSATLNNLDFPFNNSVRFGSLPTNIIPNNTTSSLSWNAYDVDGDSLLFELVNARGGANPPINLNYASGYTFQQPIASSIPTSLNAANGILTVSPNASQVSVVAMKISEFRSGMLAGSVFRDFQIVVENTTNNLPSLTGINGTSSFVTNVCPGDTLQFDIISSDPDSGQNLSLVMNNAGTSAVLNVGTGSNPTGSVFWIPTIGDISSQPYVLTVDVNDDNCDYFGSQTYAYHIYVNGCNTNDVWPGDANSDGIANLYDLLAIGLAFNDTDSIRPGATLNWNAQPCPDWSNSFISGINHKHADTDGNGTINMDDTTAIMLNYGLNHPLRISPVYSQNVVDLTVTADLDTVGTQNTVNFDVRLTSAVDSIYGLAFRLFFDPSLVDINTTQVTYAGSVFGTNGVDMLKIDKTLTNSGFVDIALTRIGLQNISNSGQVARVTIVTTDNVSGKVTLNVEPTNIEAITAYEFPITVNPIGDGVLIDPNYLGINESSLNHMISVHPIPANDVLHFKFEGNEPVQSIIFYNMDGKEVLILNQPDNKININVQSFANGVYYMKTKIGDNINVKKIVKM